MLCQKSERSSMNYYLFTIICMLLHMTIIASQASTSGSSGDTSALFDVEDVHPIIGDCWFKGLSDDELNVFRTEHLSEIGKHAIRKEYFIDNGNQLLFQDQSDELRIRNYQNNTITATLSVHRLTNTSKNSKYLFGGMLSKEQTSFLTQDHEEFTRAANPTQNYFPSHIVAGTCFYQATLSTKISDEGAILTFTEDAYYNNHYVYVTKGSNTVMILTDATGSAFGKLFPIIALNKSGDTAFVATENGIVKLNITDANTIQPQLFFKHNNSNSSIKALDTDATGTKIIVYIDSKLEVDLVDENGNVETLLSEVYVSQLEWKHDDTATPIHVMAGAYNDLTWFQFDEYGKLKKSVLLKKRIIKPQVTNRIVMSPDLDKICVREYISPRDCGHCFVFHTNLPQQLVKNITLEKLMYCEQLRQVANQITDLTNENITPDERKLLRQKAIDLMLYLRGSKIRTKLDPLFLDIVDRYINYRVVPAIKDSARKLSLLRRIVNAIT